MILRVMTWNIHGGIGTDGVCDMHRVLGLIRRQAPDILAVQEVDSRGRGKDHCGFTALRGHLPGHASAETIRAQDGAYGHMLLSRWPIEYSALHDISHPGREPRVAIEARIATPGGTLGVVATHLGLRQRERHQQAARLAALIRKLPGPLVVLGDFNEWGWRGPVFQALAAQMPARTRHRTFPSRLPALKLDRIFCRPAALMGRSWRDLEGRTASDHLPVMAELHMPSLKMEAGAP